MKILLSSTIPLSLYTFYADMPERLQRLGHEVVILSSPGKELDALSKQCGARSIAVKMERHMAPLSDLRALWRLWLIMRRERPDLVHSMTPKAGLLVMTAARLAGVRVRLHTFTGLVFPTARGAKRAILKLTDRITCACATHIIPEGRGVRNDLISNGITHKQIDVIGHGNLRGIDMDYFSRTPDIIHTAGKIRQETGGGLVFIFIGRIVADKGIRELVEAFTRLYAERDDVRLCLVGKFEPELDPLDKATTETINNHPGIRAVGQQNDVRPWLAMADVLAFPSYREGFPNVVLEAGAMGLPSIVTDINGSREIIQDGFNGLVVPPSDADRLFSAMKRMASDEQLRNRLATNARPHVEANWEQEQLRELQLEYYQKALQN